MHTNTIPPGSDTSVQTANDVDPAVSSHLLQPSAVQITRVHQGRLRQVLSINQIRLVVL